MSGGQQDLQAGAYLNADNMARLSASLQGMGARLMHPREAPQAR